MEKENMGSEKIDGYSLLKYLGGGYSGCVYLVSKAGKNYALKVVNPKNAHDKTYTRDAIVKESKIMQSLDHQNIVRWKDFRNDGIWTKSNGDTKEENVTYLVMELAEGGTLFDYVFSSGRFSEPLTRFFFKQFIDALNHLHKRGYAHRDIKLENIFLGLSFELLLADFGFSSPLQGEAGDGFLRGNMGTQGHKAPEVEQGGAYEGEPVDIFAGAVAFFMLRTKSKPFGSANPAKDSFYKIHINNNTDYWTRLGQLVFPESYSLEFKALWNKLFNPNPAQRATIQEILNDPWMNMPTPKPEEVVQELDQRRATFDAGYTKKLAEIRKRRALIAANKVHMPFEDAHRDVTIKREGMDDLVLSDETIEQLNSMQLTKPAPQYVDFGTLRFHNLYSALTPEQLLKGMVIFANNLCTDVQLDADNYTIRTTKPGTESNIEVEMSVFVNNDASVLQFLKIEGDYLDYLNFIEEFKDEIEKLEAMTFGEAPAQE